MRYRAIVADPPWRYEDDRWATAWDRPASTRNPIAYSSLDLDAICAINVPSMVAARGCHLYLWTTSAHLPDAFSVVKAWGFRYVQTLTWCKRPTGVGLGGVFTPTTEFVLFARRGASDHLRRADTSWWEWPRGRHSQKPEAFLDMVEQVSPGPYLEMFARRARFGWDYWGDESLGTVELPACGAEPDDQLEEPYEVRVEFLDVRHTTHAILDAAPEEPA